MTFDVFFSLQRTIIQIPLQWLLPLPMKWDIIWACHMIIQTVHAPLTRAALCQTPLGEANGKYIWLEYIYAMVQEICNFRIFSAVFSQTITFLTYFSNRYVYPDSFSTCSQSSLKAFLQSYDTICLLDVPNESELYGGPVCGNAFVEKGEECDCGTVKVWHVSL